MIKKNEERERERERENNMGRKKSKNKKYCNKHQIIQVMLCYVIK